MKVLIVDDEPSKAARLAACVRDCDSSAEIIHASNAHDGFAQIVIGGVNLVFLDVILPLGIGQEPSEHASIWFVREVHRKIPNNALPIIVGATQYRSAVAKVEDTFREFLWSVIFVDEKETGWLRQLTYAVRFARSNATRRRLAPESTLDRPDFAVVTALRMPEFVELVDALGGGDQIIVDETNEGWLKCEVACSGGRAVSVVAACADEMGMSAMSAMVTRLCVACRPKKLVLVGIMGGNVARVALSDLVVVEESWDWRAGKLTAEGLQADVKSQRCDFTFANAVMGAVNDDILLRLWQRWGGEKPRNIPQIHKGAVACSPSVIADGRIFEEMEDQKRKVYGVEMEAFGCYDATHRLGDLAPKVICVKSVCDLGDNKKNDVYQRYCAFLSASVAITVMTDERFAAV